MSTHPCAILGVFLMALFVQSSDSGRYQAKFENDIVAVYELDLPARASAPILQSAHDTFWLSLTEAIVNFSGTRGKTDVALQAGDIRFFPSFETRLLTNKGASEFRGVMIALKPHGLFSNGCDWFTIYRKRSSGNPLPVTPLASAMDASPLDRLPPGKMAGERTSIAGSRNFLPH